MGKRQTFIEVPKAEVGIQYTYTPLTITYCGPEPPGYNELEEYGYLKHLRLIVRVDYNVDIVFVCYFSCQAMVMSIQNNEHEIADRILIVSQYMK